MLTNLFWQPVQNIRNACYCVKTRLPNVVTIPMISYFIQITLNYLGETKPYILHVEFISQNQNIGCHHILKKIHPLTGAVASKKRPPSLNSLIGMRGTIDVGSITCKRIISICSEKTLHGGYCDIFCSTVTPHDHGTAT